MRCLALVGLLFAAPPAAAWEVCDELWFTRNLFHDRANFCFQSPLAVATFGNAGCYPGEPTLSPEAQVAVIQIEATEAALGCAVDTDATTLSVPHLAQRIALDDIPIPSEYESACIGWLGEPIDLRSARRADAPVTGRIETGDTIPLLFESADGWAFVSIGAEGQGQTGWFEEPDWGSWACETFAG